MPDLTKEQIDVEYAKQDVRKVIADLRMEKTLSPADLQDMKDKLKQSFATIKAYVATLPKDSKEREQHMEYLRTIWDVNQRVHQRLQAKQAELTRMTRENQQDTPRFINDVVKNTLSNYTGPVSIATLKKQFESLVRDAHKNPKDSSITQRAFNLQVALENKMKEQQEIVDTVKPYEQDKGRQRMPNSEERGLHLLQAMISQTERIMHKSVEPKADKSSTNKVEPAAHRPRRNTI